MSRGDNVRVIFGRNRPILGKIGRWDESRGAQVFLCGKPDDFSTTSQRPISTKFGRETYVGVPSQNPEKHLRNFYFRGHLPPKSEIENRSNRHLTQSRLQVTGCTAERYCLLHVVVHHWVSEVRSTFLYDVRLRSVKVALFSDFGLFSPYKTFQTYLPVTSLQPRGYIAEWLRFLHVIVEVPEISCDFW